ncbi:MAG TPA: serine/threonine-protein kinase [Haliangium sp.]|nr:serine/threonine-protein kinase [Haliangium sp.]
MLGQTLGNFRIIEKMSEGGMGQLYLARHVSMDRRAVVKVLRAHLLEDEVVVRRFLNEANAAAMIGHPGIVYVMDVGRLESGSPYILMEYLEGMSLAQRLENGALDIPTALSIARQIADALSAAHDKGIVHRDLKPGNIFLTRDTSMTGAERVKILDFGIAKLLVQGHDSVATHTDIILGTPLYMSPEQCDGARTVDYRSDFYSLGVILFEMVCGRTPFEPAGAGTLIAAHLLKVPPSPRSIQPSIPAELDALIMRLLAKMPEQRFHDAGELIDAIDSLIGQLSGSWVGLRAERLSSVRLAMVAPPTPVGLDRAESWTPTPPPAPPSPPAPLDTDLAAVAYPTFTAQLGAGESMLTPVPLRDRRRLWAILAGMSVVLIAAFVGWPLLQGDDQPAPRASARPASLREPPAAGAKPRPEPAAKPMLAGTSAPAPAGAPAQAAPEAASIAVEISSRPEDAEVYLDDVLLGSTPYRGRYSSSTRTLVFVVKKSGYEDQVVEIHADRDRAQVVELERKRSRRSTGRSGSRSKLRPEEGGPVDPF